MSLLSNYRILHKGCDGQITKRICSKCKIKWGLLESWITFDWYHQKLGSTKPDKKVTTRKLTGNIVADKLPYWPRWARISSTVGITLLLVGLVIYVF